MKKPRIIFVTGTDTGVGKTVLSALLVYHLRREGVHALGLKPFCSGGREDAKLLREAANQELTLDEVNPYYFPEPLAPLAVTQGKRKINLKAVIRHIQRVGRGCETLIIEGSGGVCVPLAKNLFVVDLIAKLRCEVIVVGRNQLGTINHTLLSVAALRNQGLRKIKVLQMDQARPDLSSRSNVMWLEKLLLSLGIPVLSLKYLNRKPLVFNHLRKASRNLQKPLAALIDDPYFPRRSLKGR